MDTGDMVPHMTDIDEHGRPEPPLAAGEQETLAGYLDYQRSTLGWKCRGLESKGLNTTTAASTLTLGGILKHMALVEEAWFSRSLFDRPYAPPWDAVNFKEDPDWDLRTAAEDSPEELFLLWNAACEKSRSLLAEALARGDLSQLAQRTWPDGRAPSLRWIMCHMIEEYSRHNGHADLLREAVDGETGE
jgi:uncharacterized damage-inducible protein DinB